LKYASKLANFLHKNFFIKIKKKFFFQCFTSRRWFCWSSNYSNIRNCSSILGFRQKIGSTKTFSFN